MPQVLEAPPVQDDVRLPIAIDDGDSAAQPILPPVVLRHSVMSLLIELVRPHRSARRDTTRPNESAVDRICRIDPYLYIRAMSG